MKVKDLSKYDRPREKMARYGAVKLVDHELLAIVLGSGIKGTNVVQLAKKIVTCVRKIGLEDLKLEDLLGIKGLGEVKAMQILAALEFGRRQFVKDPEVMVTPEKVFELCADIRGAKKEHFVAFYLNSQDMLIAREVISIGTLNASLVHPREVFEPAIRYAAASVVVAHNHPSGVLMPSRDDIEITENLVHAGKILGVQLLDHVIISSSAYKSISA